MKATDIKVFPVKWPKYFQEWLIAEVDSDKTCNQFSVIFVPHIHQFQSKSYVATATQPLINYFFHFLFLRSVNQIEQSPMSTQFQIKEEKSKTFRVGKITDFAGLIMSYSFLRPHLAAFSRSTGKGGRCQHTQGDRTPRPLISQRRPTVGFISLCILHLRSPTSVASIRFIYWLLTASSL